MGDSSEQSNPVAGPIDERSKEEILFDRLVAKLESIGLNTRSFSQLGQAESVMLQTLTSRDAPLQDRVGFAAAHRNLARGLEAILVSGREAVTLPRHLGPLRPIMAPFVRVVSNWIIDSQAKDVFKHVLRLYELREANAAWNSDDHRELRRARMQMQTISSDLGANRLGLPIFLLSGAFVSGLLSFGRTLVGPFLGSTGLTLLLTVLLVGLFLSITATVLVAATVAKMRLRLALVEPLTSLYRAIGDAGRIPRDKCYPVAVGALVLFALLVITVPTALFALGG